MKNAERAPSSCTTQPYALSIGLPSCALHHRSVKPNVASLGSPDMIAERRVLVWMCILVCVNQLGFGAMVPSLPLYARTFGVTASAIGLAVSIYGLARFAANMPAG